MSVCIEFDSVAQRDKVHQIIQESAKEISEHTELLETLFFLENGNGIQDGFGHVKKNNPNLRYVRFYTSIDEFNAHIEQLKSVDLNEFDNVEYERQIKSIINQLKHASSLIEKNIVN